MAETEHSAAPALTLRATVEAHHNRLYDAVALLDAAADRIDDETPTLTECPTRHERMHNLLRLVQMAGEIVKAAADDFGCCPGGAA